MPKHEARAWLPDQEVAFRRALSWAVPPDGGVYVISDQRGPLYVGRSFNLRLRFAQHLDHSHNRSLRRALSVPYGDVIFRWRLLSETEQDEAEPALVQALKPLCNVVLFAKT